MMKKIGALLLALVIVLVMNMSVFAETETPNTADMNNESGKIGEFTTADRLTLQTKTVILYKEITAYNPESCTVNAPTITYQYQISQGDAGKDIWDIKTAHDPQANAHATTKAGVGVPTISGSVDTGTTFTSGELVFTPGVKFNASSEGSKNVYQLKVDFSSVDFTTVGSGAGVYRYKITETCEENTKNAAGIKDGTIDNILYLDVYVDGNGRIYGYVCFQNNNSIDARDDATTNTEKQAAKTEGFVATTTGGTDGETEQTADSYYTFNFELSKKVENDEYAKTNYHRFPFNIKLDNPNVTVDVLPIMTVGEHAAQTPLIKSVIGTGETATVWTPTIADSATISYVGIPCGTTVTIYETNDVTGITYASKSENADNNADVKNIDTNADSNSAVINCTTHITKATENHTNGQSKKILFTNKLLNISPTGYVARFAPYALILAAGIALLLISLRRKAEKE